MSVALAALALVFLHLLLGAFHWLPRTNVAHLLAPSLDLVGLMALVLVWARSRPMPRWADRVVLGLLSLAVLACLLIGVGQGFARREFGYDLVLALHIHYVPELFRMLRDAEPLRTFVLHMVLLVVGVVAAATAVVLAVRQLRVVAGQQRRVGLILAASTLSYLAVIAPFAGLAPSVSREVGKQIALAWNVDKPLGKTARRLEVEALPLLRLGTLPDDGPKPDIFTFHVESYGEVLFDGRPASSRFPGFLAQQERALAAAGYHMRSAYRTSPVFGGSSWMADATWLCGVVISNQREYVSSFRAALRCLPRILKEAGYRTIVAASNTSELEPSYEAHYRFDRHYFKPDLPYEGPRFGWSFMPDQYVVDHIHREEVAKPRTSPLFAVYLLTSSHWPWTEIPTLVDWGLIGNGSIFGKHKPRRYTPNLNTDEGTREVYEASIEYSMSTLTSYLARLPADDRSLIFILGDHQPRQPVGDMQLDSRRVPVHVLSRDASAVERFARFGYGEGLVPPPPPNGKAPGLERFPLDLLEAYGSKPKKGQP